MESWKVWENVYSFSSLEKLEIIYFCLLVWKKKIIFQTWLFDMHFHKNSFKITNFTFIVLTIIMPVFYLGMPFKKV